MSFQDVGKKGSKRQPVNATLQQQQQPSPGTFVAASPASAPVVSSSGGVWGSLSIPSATVMSQISDSLTQYQVIRRLSLLMCEKRQKNYEPSLVYYFLLLFPPGFLDSHQSYPCRFFLPFTLF
jgi:hypothetical protein